MRIPVKHYIEITSETRVNVDCEILYTLVNESGRQYLVEVWA